MSEKNPSLPAFAPGWCVASRLSPARTSPLTKIGCAASSFGRASIAIATSERRSERRRIKVVSFVCRGLSRPAEPSGDKVTREGNDEVTTRSHQDVRCLWSRFAARTRRAYDCGGDILFWICLAPGREGIWRGIGLGDVLF